MRHVRLFFRYALCASLLLAVALVAHSNSAVAAPYAAASTYFVATNGNDANPGTELLPWKTIQNAATKAIAGDTVVMRGGNYDSVFGGFYFKNSGTASQPITFSNYSGEQVVIHLASSDLNYRAFRCWSTTSDPANWQTPKADYVRIVGSDVAPHTLSNGVTSSKGIVILGPSGAMSQAAGIEAAGCSHWEVAGVEFTDVGYGIFTKKRNVQDGQYNSSDSWYVHDNRVYGYYRESGMQFNGNYNTVVHNEIYKVRNELATPYGCQQIDVLGHNNTIAYNRLGRLGSTAWCGGLLLEWDMADYNIIEQNQISDATFGIEVAGGDNNILRNNVIYASSQPDPYTGGIEIDSYDNRTDWPCNEATGASGILPANNPSDPEYSFYYSPRNCHAVNNQILNNTIHGYSQGIRMTALVPETITVRNDAFSNWTRGGICFYDGATGKCKTLPTSVTADHNFDQGNFAFLNPGNGNFHLGATSELIDSGAALNNLVPNDMDNITRPQGSTLDVGAYEYVQTSAIKTPTPTRTVTGTPTQTATATPTSNQTPLPTATVATCASKPSAPQLIAPANQFITNPRTRLSWQASQCAQYYKVVVKQDSTLGKNITSTKTTATQFKLRKLAVSKTFYWHIAACNTYGCTWSVWNSFRVKTP